MVDTTSLAGILAASSKSTPAQTAVNKALQQSVSTSALSKIPTPQTNSNINLTAPAQSLINLLNSQVSAAASSAVAAAQSALQQSVSTSTLFGSSPSQLMSGIGSATSQLQNAQAAQAAISPITMPTPPPIVSGNSIATANGNKVLADVAAATLAGTATTLTGSTGSSTGPTIPTGPSGNSQVPGATGSTGAVHPTPPGSTGPTGSTGTPSANTGNASVSIKLATGNLLAIKPSTFDAEATTNFLFQSIGAIELLEYTRSDMVYDIDNQAIPYQPLADLSLIQSKYSPKNLSALQGTADDAENAYPIDISKYIPDTPSKNVATKNVYIEDSDSKYLDSVIVEVINITSKSGETVQIEIMDSSEVYSY